MTQEIITITVEAGQMTARRKSRKIAQRRPVPVWAIVKYDLAVIKPRELPNGLTYIGTIHKLGLDLYQYNEWYLDNWTNPNAPAQKPLVPDGTLALLSTEAEYSIYYGAITMIPEEGKTFVTVEGDRVPQTWVERRPDRRFLQVNSKPLTVPHEVNSWYVAKVL